MDIEQSVKNILERFKAADIELPEEEVKKRVELLVQQFHVPVREAERTVVNFFAKEHSVTIASIRADKVVPISECNADGKWVSIRGKVIQLWEPRNEAIYQSGLIGDSTGIVRFTIFAKNKDVATLKEGKCYQLNNVVVSEYQGNYSVKINKNSSVEEIDEDIEVSRQTEEFVGVITSIPTGSGLIKRCPECNRVTRANACGEHGKVNAVFDLRTKALVDCGRDVKEVLLNAEITEAVTGISTDKAREMATETLDMSVVSAELEKKLIGRVIKVTAARLPGAYLAQAAELVTMSEEEIAKTVNEIMEVV